MNCFDVEDVMDALSEVPDVELVELLFKYSQLEDLVMYYFGSDGNGRSFY